MGKAYTRGGALVVGCAAALAGCAPDAFESSESIDATTRSARERVGEAEAAIQGGRVDAVDRGVVGVALVDAKGTPRRACTGTLIAPDLVLTAQHCVADTARFVDCEQSVFGPPVAAERVRVTTSASMWDDDSDWTEVGAVIVPPGGVAVCGRDVALVTLARPLAGPVFAPRLDETIRAGDPYAAIGYGRSSGRAEDGGTRRRRDALRVVCVGSACQSGQVEPGEWRGDHGICNGDSGGPALDEDGGVMGVTSRGPAGCERPIYGGLVPHAAWLREEAAAAADRGGYPAAAWIGAAREPGSVAPGGLCAAAPATRGGAGWWAVVIAALALRARSRRRSACLPHDRQ